MRRGVTVKTIINSMVFDATTKDPMQRAVRDALLGFMAAMGEAQAEATKEAQKAGIAYARERLDKGIAYLGRKPSFSRHHIKRVDDGLAVGETISSIAKATGLTRQTVYRLRDHRAEAEAALRRGKTTEFPIRGSLSALLFVKRNVAKVLTNNRPTSEAE